MNHKNRFLYERFFAAVVVLLLFCTINTAPAQTSLSAEDIADKALAATVYLEMKDKGGKTLGIGSGFFVQSTLIATNYHVIEGAAKGTAKLVGKDTTYDIEGVTATDRDNDLALLKVTANGIKPLSLGDSDSVRIGETVYVAGNPKGLEGTFSDGIISRQHNNTKERLQMTAPISLGSSGGPVVNKKGEVIGVSFAIHQDLDAQNLNFAIPSKYLKALLARSKPAKPLLEGNDLPISAETYFSWGNVKYHLGNYAAAIADYTMAIRLKPDYAGAYNNRGIAKAKLEQYAAAIADYTVAIRRKPDYTGAYNNRGIAKAKLEQYAAAISDFDTVIQRKPDFAKAYNNRGNAKSNWGQHFAALTDFDTAIRLKPDYTMAYFNRGNVKGNLGQHLAAISDYDTAIEIKPNFAEAYFNRGVEKYNLGQHFAALTDYDSAIRLQLNFAEVYYNRGIVKSKLGQHLAAISDYDTAIGIKLDFTEAYFNRGVAKALLKRTSEAKQDLQKALKLAEKAGNARLKSRIEETLQTIR